MTRKERIKVRNWVRRNLGKEVTYFNEITTGTERPKGMVVGYSEVSAINEINVLISYTDDRGWQPEYIDSDDHVFVHSPLNVSFWIVDPEDLEEYIVDEYFDKGHAEQE